MMSNVSPVPEGYHTITPYLLVAGAAEAIEFYRKVFNATELLRLTSPDGRVGHAELQIGTSKMMLADEHPEMDFLGPTARGGTPVTVHLYVDDADAVFASAIAAGATELRPVFWRPQRNSHRSVGTHLVDRQPDRVAFQR